MADIEKSEASSFKATLLIGLIIICGSIIYALIKYMGFSDFRDMVVADLIFKLILFPILYMLYLALRKPEVLN